LSLLEIRNLEIQYVTIDGIVRAVNGVNFDIDEGGTLGLVGETGAGKTTTALGALRLIPDPPGRIVNGEILYNGRDLLKASAAEMRKVRGGEISMIFQDPMTSLNPVKRIGDQITEVIRKHGKMSGAEAAKKSLDMLEKVGIPAARGVEYPHQFSGGMKQRVLIAIALACAPKLIIADEPTTALDVTIQAQILEMIRKLKEEAGTSMLLITHDLGVVAETCDKIAVVYAGEIVEKGRIEDIFDRTGHPYTKLLFGSLPSLNLKVDRLTPIQGLMPDPVNLPSGCKFHPRCPEARPECSETVPVGTEVSPGHIVRCVLAGSGGKSRYIKEPAMQTQAATAPEHKPDGACELLRVEGLRKYFKNPQGMLHAVDGVSFTLEQGKTLGVVGESGCGKSTLGRAILGLLESTGGSIMFDGIDVTKANNKGLKELHRNMQIIFQDPFSSLDPRMCVAELIAEPLRVYKVFKTRAERETRVAELMDTVGLAQRLAFVYPHELDGGRRQRIGVARAIALGPKFIVCDEPVSSLDVSIQAQILNLLKDLQDGLQLTYMFITHDLSVVKHISSEIMVMYLGCMMELGGADELFEEPLHPYTKGLLSAIPIPDIHVERKRVLLEGEIGSPIEPRPSCRFEPRCPFAGERCRNEQPILEEVLPGHFAACHNIYDINGIVR